MYLYLGLIYPAHWLCLFICTLVSFNLHFVFLILQTGLGTMSVKTDAVLLLCWFFFFVFFFNSCYNRLHFSLKLSVLWPHLISHFVFLFVLQTVTGAMSTVNPPIPLGDPSNQFRVDYIQDVASQPDFDYPPVSTVLSVVLFKVLSCNNTQGKVLFFALIALRVNDFSF